MVGSPGWIRQTVGAKSTEGGETFGFQGCIDLVDLPVRPRHEPGRAKLDGIIFLKDVFP